jgi:hypothetical protein
MRYTSTDEQSARRWIWGVLLLQFLGYVLDGIWHGLLAPGWEPATVGEMVHHLVTIHLPLYVGAAGVLIATSRALLLQMRRRARDRGLPIAWVGALVSAGAEGWHAYSHLQLDTHTAPIAGVLSGVGFVVVVLAMALSSVARRQRTSEPKGGRHGVRGA